MESLKQLIEVNGKKNPFWFCGLCVIENHDILCKVAEKLKEISLRLKIPVVFKASFDKANRSSHLSFRGIGIEEGLKELLFVKKEFSLPVLTDVHERCQIKLVSEVADIIQIPAFLCRQTDLISEAAQSKKPLNIKKGQFISPSEVRFIVEKLKFFGAKDFWITERGYCFGYQRLVVDFSAFPEIESYGAHIVLDITHSVQLPGLLRGMSGAVPNAIPYLARAGAAVGLLSAFMDFSLRHILILLRQNLMP